jgi:hypothetical protein
MQELSDRIAKNQYAKITCVCIDCGKEFILNAERVEDEEGNQSLDLTGGVVGKRDHQYLCKCDECFEKDNNFGSECEVYSRVVGYIRPVKLMNDAKREEFSMRKTYKLSERD